MSSCWSTESSDCSSSAETSGSVAFCTWNRNRSCSDRKVGTCSRALTFVVTDAWPARRRMPASVASAWVAIVSLCEDVTPAGSEPAQIAERHHGRFAPLEPLLLG